MDTILQESPEVILIFQTFITTCQTALAEINYHDEAFENLKFVIHFLSP